MPNTLALERTERRTSRRFNKTFNVRIGKEEYEGNDLSREGFSVVTSEHFIHFLMKQRVKNLVICCQGVEYEVQLAEVRSCRQKRGNVIYGLKILGITHNDSILHNKVLSNEPIPLNPPTKHLSKHAGEVISELILACESEQFDDTEIRSLVLNQLYLLKQLTQG